MATGACLDSVWEFWPNIGAKAVKVNGSLSSAPLQRRPYLSDTIVCSCHKCPDQPAIEVVHRRYIHDLVSRFRKCICNMIFCESHSRVKLSQALGEKINGMRISMAHAYLNVLAFMVLLLVIVSQRVVLLDVSSAVTYTFRWHLVFMLAVSTAHLIHPTWMLKTPMTCDFWYLLVMASVMAVALVPDPGAPDHACTKNIQSSVPQHAETVRVPCIVHVN